MCAESTEGGRLHCDAAVRRFQHQLEEVLQKTEGWMGGRNGARVTAFCALTRCSVCAVGLQPPHSNRLNTCAHPQRYQLSEVKLEKNGNISFPEQIQ